MIPKTASAIDQHRSNHNGKIKYKKYKKSEQILIKTYKPQNSLLTDLLVKDKNLKSFYYIGICLFIYTALNTAITDISNEGRVYMSSRSIKVAFKNFSYAFVIWIIIFLSNVSVYWFYILWAKFGKKLKYDGNEKCFRNSFLTSICLNTGKLWNLIWLTLFATYYPGLVYFAGKLVLLYDLGIFSSICVLFETTRLLMKAHAFVRTNIPKHLIHMEDTLYPTFSQYIYFSFSPTLIYYDTYPRSNNPVRWDFVGKCFFEIIVGVLFISFVFERAYANGFWDYGIRTYTWVDIMFVVFHNNLAGFIIILVFFYCGFHSYLNFTAELLGFSDRLFYGDWWAAETPSRVLRKWNIFVSDWLSVYVYRDLYKHVFKHNKFLSKFIAFFLSGIFHDYIICVSARLFLPVITITFSVTIAIYHYIALKNIHLFHVAVWIGFGVAINLIFTILSIEYFARINCPMDIKSTYDIIKPRFLYC